ncbi:MAG: DUF1501 domain-containing protein, partial [Verrucomicrobiota bacterium]
MNLSRRDWIKRCGAGFGSLALADLLAAETQPHFTPRAKRVIFLFMHGGPSHIDTFDYKPKLQADHGKPLPFAKPRIEFAKTGNLLKSPWAFKQHGASGAWVSELFPKVAGHIDDLCMVKSLHGSNEAHGGACLMVHTGTDTFIRPSMGAWISYGLGTDNGKLPAFITMNPTLGHGGVQNYGSAFLPATHQATRISKPADALKGTAIGNIRNQRMSSHDQRAQLDLLNEINRLHLTEAGHDPNLEARIESFELAFQMQTAAPEVMDIKGESETTQKMYGIDDKNTGSFALQCLLARRMAEAGVRFVQCTHGYWDQHSNLNKKHTELSAQVDQPIAALLTDLKGRGLLEDTLVIWGGEFGRTPVAQGKDGRDHNPHGFT